MHEIYRRAACIAQPWQPHRVPDLEILCARRGGRSPGFPVSRGTSAGWYSGLSPARPWVQPDWRCHAGNSRSSGTSRPRSTWVG